jgi:spermidine synthase
MRDRPFLVVASCFFLSGFAALIYETAWIREFSFVFGTSELAVATVLAAYMAGLAGGAAVAGRLAPRIRRPLLVYALLEAGIGLAALLVPIAIAGATSLLVALFGGQREFGQANAVAISAFYLVATFVIVMVPTFFMGATLPLLSRHAVHTDAQIGPRIGALYSINTTGAVAGTLAAAFLLLPALGIRSTVWVGVAINGVVFLIATGLVRISGSIRERGSKDAETIAANDAREVPETSEATGTSEASPSGARRWHFVLPLILVSGALSFAYEVLWTRLLSQLLGGSIYAFTTMLASFLAGIALGSALASRVARSSDRALVLFAWAEVGVAVLTAISFWLIDDSRALIRMLGSESYLAVDVTLSMVVLLPAALCIGATFPLAVRVLARDADDAGSASARVYSWNTVGAIVGSIGAAFVLLPELGFRGTILFGTLANLAIAGVALTLGSARRLVVVPLGLALVLVVALPGEPWEVLRSSPLNLDTPPKTGELGFYAVGRGATVLLTKETPVNWRISTNGLPESMIWTPEEVPGRSPTGVLLGAIGAILRPEANSMLMVGLGGGVSLERVPGNIERIDVIELEEEVVAANRWLGSHRDIDPLADPRVRVHVNDARSALFLSDEKFDVIAAQASHPWTGGAAHLYSGEFFELVSRHLHEEGVFVQWVGPDFIDAELFRAIVATLLEHFEYVQIYREVLFVASNAPLPDVVDFEALRTIDPEVSRQLGLYTAEDLAALMLMDSESAARFAEGGGRISDDRNLLQMHSPKIVRSPAVERRKLRKELMKVYKENDPLPRRVASKELDGVALVGSLKEAQAGRAKWLARKLEDPADRTRLRALGLFGSMGRAELEDYLKAHPEDAEARARALRLDLADEAFQEEESRWRSDRDLSLAERAVLDAEAARRRSDWESLAALDDRLAAISPGTPLYADATTFRVIGRIQSGDPERAEEAIDFVDDLYRIVPSNPLLILRARAAALAGNPRAELASLAQVRLKGPPALVQQWRVQVNALLRQVDVGTEGELADWRNELLTTRFRLAG